MAFPAVSADGEAGDGVTGDAGRRGGDLHLDGASSLFIGLQRRAMERRLDGVPHLSKSQTLEQHRTFLNTTVCLLYIYSHIRHVQVIRCTWQ